MEIIKIRCSPDVPGWHTRNSTVTVTTLCMQIHTDAARAAALLNIGQ